MDWIPANVQAQSYYDPVIIAAAIPFFLLLIGVELWWSQRVGRRVYRFDDTVADLACGLGNRALGLLWVGATFVVYAAVYERLALFDLSAHPALMWTVALVGQDLTYYLYHRASHRVNFLWATHVVHHQSDEYNLAVALRQSWFTSLTGWVFDLPLALLGVPPLVYATVAAVNLLYQFWIHTRLVSRLGPLETVLNTPSHHRVHHGTEARYLDCNYAGIFIVWDRLFGTFVPERDEPTYGTVRPFRSLDPLWANVEPWLHLAWMASQARTWREKLRVWVSPPEWKPQGVDPLAMPAPMAARSLAAAAGSEARVYPYVALWGAPAVGLVVLLLVLEPRRTLLLTALLSGALVWLLVAQAALMERRPQALTLERARLAAALVGAVALGLLLPAWRPAAAGLVVLALGSAVWLHRLVAPHRLAARAEAPVG